MENGQLKGAAVEIVNLIQQQLGSKTLIDVLPWKRAYLIAESEPNIAIFSMARSQQRENKFFWIGPIATKKYGFYALAERGFTINSIAQIGESNVGVQRGSRRETYLNSLGLKSLQPVMLPAQNMGKLIKGRIDLWYTSHGTMTALAKAYDLNPNSIHEVIAVKYDDLYIGFNRHSPKEVTNKWQEAYKSLYEQGKIKEIYQKRQEEYLFPKTFISN
jgi:polar amino acid transport system substrate-binding protein